MRTFSFASHCHIGDMVICTGAVRNVRAANPDIIFTVPDYCRDVYRVNDDFTGCARRARQLGKITYGTLQEEKVAAWGNVVEGFTRSLCGLLGVPMVPIVTRTPVLRVTDYEEELSRPWRGWWLLNANCQTCSQSKGYPHWQDVIDLLGDGWKIAQVGGNEPRDLSPDLRRVLDMRGGTTLRDLIVMVYGCAGVISPPSAITSIAAAFGKPQIVLNAGREPDRLTDYPNAVHISHVCSCGYGVESGCIACRMGATASRGCVDTIEANGRKWARCQWETPPEEIACLARELRASTVNYN